MINLKNYETWNLEPARVVLVSKTPRSWLVYMRLILFPIWWLSLRGVEPLKLSFSAIFPAFALWLTLAVHNMSFLQMKRGKRVQFFALCICPRYVMLGYRQTLLI